MVVRRFYVLRIARNGFVHTGGDLKRLDKPSARTANGWRGRPKDPRSYVRRFAKDLSVEKIAAGRLSDEVSTVPAYLIVTRNGYVELVPQHACKWIGQRFQWCLQEAGMI